VRLVRPGGGAGRHGVAAVLDVVEPGDRDVVTATWMKLANRLADPILLRTGCWPALAVAASTGAHAKIDTTACQP
jgi:hypothetical protein